VANKTVNASQLTIVWHVDDLKISHRSEQVLDEEIKWLESIYGPLVGANGTNHTYLGMDLAFQDKKLCVSMKEYLREIIEEFPYEFKGKVVTPAAPYLFDKYHQALPLDANDTLIFHHTVAKILWAAMRACPDVLTALSFLTCCVKAPGQDDMKKLMRLLSYIRETINLPLTIGMDDSNKIRWWVDASFGTRFEMRSQTGGTMSLGIGSIYYKLYRG
jgi:hypothetical protein